MIFSLFYELLETMDQLQVITRDIPCWWKRKNIGIGRRNQTKNGRETERRKKKRKNESRKDIAQRKEEWKNECRKEGNIERESGRMAEKRRNREMIKMQMFILDS